MPAPANPPPADEAGAILSPRQLNRWLDVNPVSPLTRTQTYLVVPAFNLLTSWFGYSTLIGAYNFTGTRNFTLPPFDVPTNPNYILCISWHEGGMLHRYKLWEDVGEVFYFDAPLYTGQLIKANFRFEVWTTVNSSFAIIDLNGAGNANTNQSYTIFSTIAGISLWVGVDRAITNTAPFNTSYIAYNTLNADIYYRVSDSIFGIWTVDTGTPPAPYVTFPTSYMQLTNLTFYTSVRGNYDYMWQDDMALSTASIFITDFNIADTNAPWTAPDNSVSATN